MREELERKVAVLRGRLRMAQAQERELSRELARAEGLLGGWVKESVEGFAADQMADTILADCHARLGDIDELANLFGLMPVTPQEDVEHRPTVWEIVRLEKGRFSSFQVDLAVRATNSTSRGIESYRQLTRGRAPTLAQAMREAWDRNAEHRRRHE